MATRETVEAARAFTRQCLSRLTQLEENGHEEWREDPCWARGSDGSYRKYAVVLRESPTLRIFQEFESLPGYSRALSLLTADPLVGSHLDTLVGHRYSGRRIEFQDVVFSLIYAMQNVTGELEYTDDRFDQAWVNLVESLEVQRIPLKMVAVIPRLELLSAPVQLDHQLTLASVIRAPSRLEVTSCR